MGGCFSNNDGVVDLVLKSNLKLDRSGRGNIPLDGLLLSLSSDAGAGFVSTMAVRGSGAMIFGIGCSAILGAFSNDLSPLVLNLKLDRSGRENPPLDFFSTLFGDVTACVGSGITTTSSIVGSGIDSISSVDLLLSLLRSNLKLDSSGTDNPFALLSSGVVSAISLGVSTVTAGISSGIDSCLLFLLLLLLLKSNLKFEISGRENPPFFFGLSLPPLLLLDPSDTFDSDGALLVSAGIGISCCDDPTKSPTLKSGRLGSVTSDTTSPVEVVVTEGVGESRCSSNTPNDDGVAAAT